MSDKVLVLTAGWAAETWIVGVFTSPEKLKAYTDRHPKPEIPGAHLAEYDEPQTVKVDQD